MSDLVLVKGDRSRLLWANSGFLEYYGMTNEELENIVDSPHSDPDDTVQYVKDDHDVFTSGKTLDIPSEPITDSSGKVAYYHTIKTAIKDDEGRVIRTVGVSRPITDERVRVASDRDRGDRKQTLGKLRTMVRYMPLAVAMFDVKQRFLSYSLAWSALFGVGGDHDADNLAGQFYDLTCETRFALTERMAAAINSGQTDSIRAAVMESAAGDELNFDVEIRPWSLPSGDIGGVIVLLHDITRMTRAQQELVRLNEELMQFNYRVSHDLLAPLKTVLGFVDLCELELEDGNVDEVRSYHGIIKENVASLGALVEDVLNLARADVSRTGTDTVELEQLLRDAVSKYQSDIDAADIAVAFDIDVPTLRAERVRVQQVMENLIANAIKYHDPHKSERQIRITARATDGPSPNISVTVRDNGIGFDEHLSAKIFAIFTRGTSKHPGSGLGLYIVKKHLDQLGGAIRVLSNRDDTVFEVSLPLSATEAPN